MSFQTSCGSSASVSASTLEHGRDDRGGRRPWQAGRCRSSQVTVPSETPAVPAPAPARASVKVAPSGDGDRHGHVVEGLVGRVRDGEPRAGRCRPASPSRRTTRSCSRASRVVGAESTLTEVAPARCADQLPVAASSGGAPASSYDASTASTDSTVGSPGLGPAETPFVAEPGMVALNVPSSAAVTVRLSGGAAVGERRAQREGGGDTRVGGVGRAVVVELDDRADHGDVVTGLVAASGLVEGDLQQVVAEGGLAGGLAVGQHPQVTIAGGPVVGRCQVDLVVARGLAVLGCVQRANAVSDPREPGSPLWGRTHCGGRTVSGDPDNDL